MTLDQPQQREEYVTIIAPTAADAMAQFKERGLDRDGYLIAGQIGRHQVCLVQNQQSSELFSGAGMVAATFSRRVGI
jgi:hypothetical protein